MEKIYIGQNWTSGEKMKLMSKCVDI